MPTYSVVVLALKNRRKAKKVDKNETKERKKSHLTNL
jgi:hypothetical protein